MVHKFELGLKAAQEAATAQARAVAARAIHVKIFPRPRNLAESQQVLRQLKRFGEVEMYRGLKWEKTPAGNSALAIYKTSAAAEQAIFSSPLSFTMNPTDTPPQTQSQQTSSSSSSSSSPSYEPEPTSRTIRYPPMTVPTRSSRATPVPSSPPPKPRKTAMYVTSSTLQHKVALKRGYYYAPFQPGDGPLVRPGVHVLGGLGREGKEGKEVGKEEGDADVQAQSAQRVLGDVYAGNELPPGLDGLGNWDVRKQERPWGLRMRVRRRGG